MRENKHDPAPRRKVHERDVERAFVERVEALGGEVRKVKWIGRVGAPDRVVFLPGGDISLLGPLAVNAEKGRTIWVELKAPGEKPEPHQLREHKRMRAMGCDVRVIDSIRGALAFP